MSVSFNDSQIYVQEMEPNVSVCLELQNVLEPTQDVIWATAIIDFTGNATSESCCIFTIHRESWHRTECIRSSIQECLHKEDLDYQIIIAFCVQRVAQGGSYVSLQAHFGSFATLLQPIGVRPRFYLENFFLGEKLCIDYMGGTRVERETRVHGEMYNRPISYQKNAVLSFGRTNSLEKVSVHWGKKKVEEKTSWNFWGEAPPPHWIKPWQLPPSCPLIPMPVLCMKSYVLA